LNYHFTSIVLVAMTVTHICTGPDVTSGKPPAKIPDEDLSEAPAKTTGDAGTGRRLSARVEPCSAWLAKPPCDQ